MAGGAEQVLLDILVVLAAAKLGGEIAERFGQSSVLGELLIGIIIGPSLLGWIDPHALIPEVGHIKEEGLGGSVGAGDLAHIFDLDALLLLAEIGVLLLLFEVGLESDVKELVRVGPSALLVGIIGIVGSFAAGYGSSWGFAQLGYWPDEWLFHTFVGATLTATSVGITARVLADLGKLNTDEARIILGAAVFDDIGGLLILAIVAALAAGDALTGGQIGLIILQAIGFLIVAVAIGMLIFVRILDILAKRMRTSGGLLVVSVAFMLLMAYLAGLAGLAGIVGAFAGGLILAQSEAAHRIFNDVRPVGALFVPFFFVMLGVQVNLSDLGGRGMSIVVVGLVLTVIAIIAKLASGWGVVSKGTSKLVVGVGMAPRGEVGLIFALLGLTSGILENWEYTAIIVVVMLTTFVTPIWLKKIAGRMHAGEGPHPTREGAGEILEV